MVTRAFVLAVTEQACRPLHQHADVKVQKVQVSRVWLKVCEPS